MLQPPKTIPSFPRTKRKQFQPLLSKIGRGEWEYEKAKVGEVALLEAQHRQAAQAVLLVSYSS